MRVGRVGSGSAAGYIPMQDRIFANLASSVNRAKRQGKTEFVQFHRDSPALEKAVEALREHFEVQTEKSDKVKVTVKL